MARLSSKRLTNTPEEAGMVLPNPDLGTGPVPVSSWPPPALVLLLPLGFSDSKNEAGGLEPGGAWWRGQVSWRARIPVLDSPQAAGAKAPSPQGWNPGHPIPGWPGKHQACQEWTQLSACPRAPSELPSSCCRLQGRNEGSQAKGCGKGSRFLCLFPLR